ncbi:MAG: peptidylprolyl isomerase [Flavobacteriales bacterium]
MAAIGEIRKRSWLLVVVIVVGMLAFILGDTLSRGGGAIEQAAIATVNGEEITSLDYQQMVEAEFDKTNRAFQALNGQPAPSSMKQQLTGNYLSQYLNQEMFQAEYDKLGIEVTDEEFNDLLQGNNVDGQLYEPYGFFVGPDRKFNRDSLNRLLPSYLQNPGFQFFFENIIGEQAEKSQLQNKYFNMLEKGLYVTSYEAKKSFEANGNTVNFDFVHAPFSSVTIEEANVTEADMKAYYAEHKNEKKYKQKDKVSFQFVEFEITPSEEDLAGARDYLEERVELFKEAKNDTTFVMNNSDSKNTNFGEGNFPSEIDSIVNNAQNGDVIGPYRDGDFFKISKVLKNSFKQEAEVRHILLGNNEYPNQVAQQERADSLVKALKRNRRGFEDAVEKFTTDLGSKEKGGKYEWFDDKTMVPEFTKVSFEEPIGTITQTRTQFGIHIIEVLGRRQSEDKELIVATVDSEIRRSRETINSVRDRALEFITSFDKNNVSDSAFRSAATKAGLSVTPADDILITQKDMPEFGSNFDQVKKWAFNKNTDNGDISDELVFDRMVAVAHLLSRSQAGIPTWENLSQNMKNSIEYEVMNDKKAKILKERMAGTNLEEIAGKVNASVMSAENVTLSSSNVTNIGNEPAVVGTAFGMEVNATSKPVAGNSGVFVVRLKANNPVAIPDNFDQQKSAGTTQLRSNAKNRAFEALKDLSGMEDNRERVNVIGN